MHIQKKKEGKRKMIKCVGCKYSSGVFPVDGKEITYDNAILYCVSDEDKEARGLVAYEVKLNRQKMILEGVNAFDELVDHIISFTVSIGKKGASMVPNITGVKLIK